MARINVLFLDENLEVTNGYYVDVSLESPRRIQLREVLEQNLSDAKFYHNIVSIVLSQFTAYEAVITGPFGSSIHLSI